MKTHCTILATALAAALSASAKTFDWPIDAPTAGARQFTAYHGETVRFNLQFRGAMTNLSPRAIYYQTNGMGRAEWFGPVPGTVFHPTNDCGAAFYRFFIRCADPDGVDYTANGSLRLLDSPGFDPATVQLPVQTLDFSKIEVLNPPWGEGGGGVTQELDPVFSQWETNMTEGGYVSVSNKAMTITLPGDAGHNPSVFSPVFHGKSEYSDEAEVLRSDPQADQSGYLSMVTRTIESGGLVTFYSWPRLYDGHAFRWLADENSLTKLDTEVAAKQDALPYPTNAIPYSAIEGTPSVDFSTNNVSLVATASDATSNTVTKAYVEGLGISSTPELYDPVRDRTWVSAVTNGVFFWYIKED